MTPAQLRLLAIQPTLALLGSRYQSVFAERMLVAIAIQESALKYRVQVGGPARGWWQFERGGGVNGVLSHPQSVTAAQALCMDLLYRADAQAVHMAITDNDILACGFARLLLWTDPKPLPTTEADGWSYYQRNWRPGKPHPEKWSEAWRLAQT